MELNVLLFLAQHFVQEVVNVHLNQETTGMTSEYKIISFP